MARKLRLEYPGAIYHVINRGNYRAWAFRDDQTRAAFEACVFEACRRCGWLLHGFVIMGNHYHLAIETPQGNLVSGMQWLQSTFANRFNKFRGEQGHLFQGRFKSLVVEPGGPLGQVCHYLHLNPVRAGIVTVDQLADFRFSSYWYLLHPKERPDFLRVDAALADAGDLTDTPAGWRCYGEYLAWQAASGPAGKNAAYASLSRGWVIGSDGFKQSLLKDHALLESSKAWESDGGREIRAARWTAALDRCLACLTPDAPDTPKKSAPWKVAAAAYLKDSTDVTNSWLADQLGMGSPFYVSKHVGLLRRTRENEASRLLARLRTKMANGHPTQTAQSKLEEEVDPEAHSLTKSPTIVEISSTETDDGTMPSHLK